MVDIESKPSNERIALARACIRVPTELIQTFQEDELHTKKGPVFQTAILAGIMGAKKTSELIPLCHQIALNKCEIEINITGENTIQIDCKVKTNAKTGVEMEALSGASIAALTVYDMCKGFTHNIVIEEVKLLMKKGGKRDFERAQ